jgi:HSP20 family protein
MRNELDIFRGHEWNPMREFSALQRDLNRLFDQMFAPSRSEGAVGFAPACDVEETDTAYSLSFDLPGVDRENIKIEVQDRDLIVSGERSQETRQEKNSRKFIERTHGSFKRVFTLPASANLEKVEAAYDQGVLRIGIPKREAIQTKQIPIAGSPVEGGKKAEPDKRPERVA